MNIQTFFIASFPIAVLLLGSDNASAQYRENAGEVITPPAAKASPVHDPSPALAKAYSAAGRPRIVLFWNRDFAESTRTETVSKDITHVKAISDSNGLDKETNGAAGKATLRQADEKLNSTRIRTRTAGAVDDGSRVALLSERNAALLESIVVNQVTGAGVHFINRSMIVRSAAATGVRETTDPKLYEMEALRNYADLLLELHFVADKDAPLGSGFKILLTSIKDGSRLLAWYSQGIPDPVPAGRGAWVPTDRGYEYRPPPQPTPEIVDVGMALARDLMLTLTDALDRTGKN